MHGTLSVERDGPVATLTVARPPVNALSLAMLESMAEELRRLAADPGVSAIVWRSGLPGVFSAGFDLKDSLGGGRPQPPIHFPPGDHAARVRNAQTALLELPVPIVAAVNGAAVGLGMLMPALCDIVIAARSARFGLPEIRIGSIGGAGHARRILPEPVLRYLMLTGRRVPPEYLQQCGAIALVVDDDRLDEEARAIAREIGACDPAVVRNTKLALEALRTIDDVGLAYSIEHKWGAALRLSRRQD